jgi:hypothetical protein
MNTTKASTRGTDRKIATIVGVLFIIGTAAGILSVPVMGGILGAPDVLNMVAANQSQVAFGALLMLIMGLALAMVPALMFPILKRLNEPLAIGYVILRGALETFTTLALAMCWLLLVVVARQYADSVAAVASQLSSLGILLVKAPDTIMTVGSIVFGLGALVLYCLFYQARLIPRWISGWGIVAAVATLAANFGAMFGTDLAILELVMLPQEMVMAVWLIARGFNSSAMAALSAKAE